ncbi:hypothetical protein VNO78_09661 [Psophocarpus tetragonolobus]|uniref:Uncharacterized protein n=1 Tax=Psophocarpus tetragonolobus TaxID=3891 RepID=A0AAN9XTQ8_PSOTE
MGQNATSEKIAALVSTMNAAMECARGIAARSGEIEKSSSMICTSLAKLESALNSDSLGEVGHTAKLFGPENDHESTTCQGIRKSKPFQTHDQIPNKKAKPSNDPNDISDEDDKINLFDNESKGIRPLNDPDNFHSVPRLTNVGMEQFPTPLAMHIPMNTLKLDSHARWFYYDSEVLLRIGDASATTRDIECLCSGMMIEDKIYLTIKDGEHWYSVVVSLEERIVHHLDSCFHVGQLNEKVVRMRTAMDLLLWPYNECKETLKRKLNLSGKR